MIEETPSKVEEASYSNVLTPRPKRIFIKDFVRKWIEEKCRDPCTIKLLSDVYYNLVKPLAEAGLI